MALLAEPNPPALPVAQHGFVVDPPAALGESFTARLPNFDDLHVFQIRRWEFRGATLPVAGDEVLVVVDDISEPWAVAWWPGEGDAEVLSAPIKSSQIESLEAAKITGQLTNAQLKEIEAAKVSGKLISAQIESIEAAKITGQLTSAQIKELEAAKLTGQITETQITNEAVSAPKIKAGSIETAKLAASAITAEKIAAESIETSKLKADSVTSAKIAAGTIVAGDIAALTITAEKLAANSITSEKIVTGTIIATNIAAGTITATQIAASTIETGNLKAEAITTTLLAANSVTSAKIVAGTIEASDIKAGTITANEIAALTITAAQIAAGTITSGQIASGTITGGNIASGTITAGNITVSSLSALSANLGTITAGTVTGATLRTAAEGNRVVIDSKGLHAYKGVSTGVLDFDIETGGLKLTGKIEEGSEIPAAAITGQLTSAQIKELEAAKIAGRLTGAQMQLPGAIYVVFLNYTFVNAAPGAIGFFESNKPETATQLYINQTDARGHALTEWLTNLVSAGEALKGQFVVQSLKDATKMHIFKVTGLHGEGTKSKRYDVQWKSGSGEFEAGEEVSLYFQLGAIVAESLTTGYIAAGAITTGKIAASAVTAEQIAASTITTTQIAANTIEAGDIKASTITTTEIAANTILAGDIAAETITATQIAASTITGAKIAATTIAASNIISGTITATQIKAGTITATELAANSVEASQIKAGAVTATKLSVSELSAITANLGTITAGTITGVTFTNSGKDFTLDKNGLNINAGESESPSSAHKVLFVGGSSEPLGEIYDWHFETGNTLQIKSKRAGSITTADLRLEAEYSIAGGKEVELLLSAESSGQRILYQAGGEVGTVIDSAGKSNFLQLTATAKQKINSGTATLEWQGTAFSKTLEIKHELGVEPKAIAFAPEKFESTFMYVVYKEVNSTRFKVEALANASITSGKTSKIGWMAIG